MFVFNSQLVTAAREASMAVPDNPDDFNPDAYPHFTAFCNTQLNRSIVWGEEYNNAKTIAQIPIQRIKHMSYADFAALGVYPS